MLASEFGEGSWEIAPQALQGNDGQISFFTFHPDPAFGRVTQSDGTTPLSAGYLGQLHGRPSLHEQDWVPLGDPVSFGNGSRPGYLHGGLITIPGTVNAQDYFLQLRVWDQAAGTTYEQARANGGLAAQSSAFKVTVGALEGGLLPGLPPPDANLFPSFNLPAAQTNMPPVLSPMNDLVVHAGVTVTLTNQAQDPETPASLLAFHLASGPNAAFLNSSNGVFTWTPTDSDAPGTNLVTVEVTDDGLPPMTSQQSFQIIVLPRPYLGQLTHTNGVWLLTWSAAPGSRYQVDYKEDLNDPSWQPLPAPVISTNYQAFFEDNLEAVPQRFYRIRVLP